MRTEAEFLALHDAAMGGQILPNEAQLLKEMASRLDVVFFAQSCEISFASSQ